MIEYGGVQETGEHRLAFNFCGGFLSDTLPNLVVVGGAAHGVVICIHRSPSITPTSAFSIVLRLIGAGASPQRLASELVFSFKRRERVFSNKGTEFCGSARYFQRVGKLLYVYRPVAAQLNLSTQG